MYREIAAIYVWTAGAHFVVNLVVQLKCASSSVQRNTTKSRRHQQDENDKADAGAQNPAERVPARRHPSAPSPLAPPARHAQPMLAPWTRSMPPSDAGGKRPVKPQSFKIWAARARSFTVHPWHLGPLSSVFRGRRVAGAPPCPRSPPPSIDP